MREPKKGRLPKNQPPNSTGHEIKIRPLMISRRLAAYQQRGYRGSEQALVSWLHLPLKIREEIKQTVVGIDNTGLGIDPDQVSPQVNYVASKIGTNPKNVVALARIDQIAVRRTERKKVKL